MVEQRWPGRTADGLASGAWCTRGASGDREPRVSLDLQGETSGEHCLTCPRRASTREEALGAAILCSRAPGSVRAEEARRG